MPTQDLQSLSFAVNETTIRSPGRRLVLRIPGSTSNLGPGLDTCALALDINCWLIFDVIEKNDPNIPFVTFSGSIASGSRPDHTGNLIYKLMNDLWVHDRSHLGRIRIQVHSDIPLGSGLGGSSAIILGALWAVSVFDERIPLTATLLARASRLEGHSETLAASLMGNFVIVGRSAFNLGIVARQHKWPSAWKTIFVVPRTRMRTAESRAVLPPQLSYRDAIANIQRTALLVSAVTTVDEHTLKEALHDRIHERYRESLFPHLPSLKNALVNQPILGCVLSGGGPSVLVIVHEKHKDTVLAHLHEWAQTEAQPPMVWDIPVAAQGIQEIQEQR